jgi:hypothetical protein
MATATEMVRIGRLSAQQSLLSPSPPPSELCNDENNIVIRSAMDALRNSKKISLLHRKKRFTSFPSPAGMSRTKLPLGRNNSVMMSLFPPSESLVETSRLGTGNSRTFFYGVDVAILFLFTFFNLILDAPRIFILNKMLYTWRPSSPPLPWPPLSERHAWPPPRQSWRLS